MNDRDKARASVTLRPGNGHSLSFTVRGDGSAQVTIHCPAGYLSFTAHPTAAEQFARELAEEYGVADRGDVQ